MQRIKLRERGIYALPDSREFIVRANGKNEYSLYPSKAWNRFVMAEYRLNSEGLLLSKGTRTRWQVKDLIDTGKALTFTPGPVTSRQTKE